MIEDNLIYGFHGEFRWLSNFWPAEVVYGGITFPTVEHAYQAAKSNDKEVHELMSILRTPGIAKSVGKSVPMRSDWEDVKIEIMTKLVRQKFSFHSELGNKLQATGDAMIVEANTWRDRFWGKHGGTGKNHLGIILMTIRDELNFQARNEQ